VKKRTEHPDKSVISKSSGATRVSENRGRARSGESISAILEGTFHLMKEQSLRDITIKMIGLITCLIGISLTRDSGFVS
jgi:hypothetical protein